MKSLLLILITIFLIQSCIVYQKTPVSLDNAYGQGRVRLENNAGKVYTFKKIEMENGKYYGVSKKGHTLISSSEISSVYLVSKTKSVLASMGIIAGGYLIVALTVVILLSFDVIAI